MTLLIDALSWGRDVADVADAFRGGGRRRREVFGRQRQEDFFEAHARRARLPQPPAARHDRAGQIAADVASMLALDLVADHAVFPIRFDDAGDAGDPGERGLRIRAVRVHLHVQRFRAAQPRRQVVGRVNRDDTSLVDDDDALTGLRDLGQNVRAQDDRVIAGEVLDELPRFDNLLRVGVERWRLRQIAGPALRLERLVEDVEACDNRLPFGSRHVAGQDAHRRGFPGAVGAEEAEDFAALDAEADVVDGCDAAVAFREVLNLDHRKNSYRLYREAPLPQRQTKMLSEAGVKM